MHPTRREMLRLGLGSSALLACGATVPTFLARSAMALADTPSSGSKKGRILIVLQLDGGNDGLNTVVPYRDDAYRRLRPKLQIPAKEVKTIDDRVGLHPDLKRFARLLENQELAIVQGVGYPNPNRSHFESMTIWQTAQPNPDAATSGWLAKTLDHRPQVTGDAGALHIHDALPLPQALIGGSHMVPSLDRPEQFQRRIGLTSPAEAAHQREALDQLGQLASGEPGSLLDFVEQSRLITYANSARLEAVQKGAQSPKNYPEFYGLARQLRLIAQLIKAGLATTIYYTHLDGFDTHADQLGRHSQLLRELDESVHAFLDDLTQAGEADRVVILVFSEFGRRVAENDSEGTDHGTAAPTLLLGKPVRAGLHGLQPDLDKLVDGDPQHTTDFRRVYATLLDQWLKVPSKTVLAEAFDPIPLIRA